MRDNFVGFSDAELTIRLDPLTSLTAWQRVERDLTQKADAPRVKMGKVYYAELRVLYRGKDAHRQVAASRRLGDHINMPQHFSIYVDFFWPRTLWEGCFVNPCSSCPGDFQG
jgi:hypothetical protein